MRLAAAFVVSAAVRPHPHHRVIVTSLVGPYLSQSSARVSVRVPIRASRSRIHRQQQVFMTLASSTAVSAAPVAVESELQQYQEESRVIGDLVWKFIDEPRDYVICLADENQHINEASADDLESGGSSKDEAAPTLLGGSVIPDSVLQYERQLRKVQAEFRSNNKNLTIDEHLHVIYEDDTLIVINKPAGVLCVPGLNDKPNLLGLVREYLGGENADLLEPSRMIVHRLDMDTSGLVVFAKTHEAMQRLQAAFRDRFVDKEYHALVCGHIMDGLKTAQVHLPLQRDHEHPPFMRVATRQSERAAQEALVALQTHGWRKLVKKKPKPSHTQLKVLGREYYGSGQVSEQSTTRYEDYDDAKTPRLAVTRLSLIPHTGRTHQLRVHCAALGHPIVGDPAYGVYGEAHPWGGLREIDDIGASLELQQAINAHHPPHSNPMCLHATRLALKHPITGERMEWNAPVPF